MTMTNTPIVPIPPLPGDNRGHDRDDAAADSTLETEAAIVRDDDGNPVLDPDVNDDLVDSADADRLAAGAAEED